VIRVLLALYPKAWRRTYGEEFAALLEQTRLTPRVVLDVLAQATKLQASAHRARFLVGAAVLVSIGVEVVARKTGLGVNIVWHDPCGGSTDGLMERRGFDAVFDQDVSGLTLVAARHAPDAELVTWWGERYCKAVLGEVVRPDGVGVWREGDTTVVFCLEYDRGREELSRLIEKAADYARLERAWGIPFWLLVVVPGPRRQRGVRAVRFGYGLAVATTTQPDACRPDTAIWAPLDAEGARLRLAELAGWLRPAASTARLAECARLVRADESAARAG